MGFRLGAPGITPDRLTSPKIAWLHRSMQCGLPVPAGYVIEGPDDDDEALRESVRGWLDAGSLIVRSAARDEDLAGGSRAGLGRSVAGILDELALTRALASLWRAGADQVLVQVAVSRDWLLVVAGEAGHGVGVEVALDPPVHAEAHGAAAGDFPLASGRSPDFSGPLDAWDEPARRGVLELVAAVRARVPELADPVAFPHGFDLEIVVDAAQAWLVQLRPLVAALLPGWPRFCATVTARGETIPARGALVLDAEHNPAPLSPAHAWLMRWLASVRKGVAGDPVVLAGWLYMRALPRDLADADGSATADRDPTELRRVMEQLVTRDIPEARRCLEEIRASLATDRRPEAIANAFERSKAHFLAMIDLYVGTLVPTRRRFRSSSSARPAAPLSLSDRERFLDVLPAQWDLASASLSELLALETATQVEPEVPPTIPNDPGAAATLLGEWDDHLFALGLAPLREVWLAAGAALGLAPGRAFLLDGDELGDLLGDLRGDLRGGGTAPADLEDRLARRERAQADCAQLHPPLRIRDGHPEMPAPGRLLRGFPIGDTCTGPVAVRHDLAELIATRPPLGSILCMPTLTAQAAVVLARLGITAVCTEHGGALAHGALMARELGLSALIGCTGCTRLSEGTLARLDTLAGRLFVLAEGH